MSNMQTLECSVCGSPHLIEVRSDLFKCKNCHASNYRVDAQTNNLLTLANDRRMNYDFEGASNTYRSIYNDNYSLKGQSFVMACMGLIYCTYGINFISSFDKNFSIENGFTATPIFSIYNQDIKNEKSLLDSKYYKDILSANIPDEDKNQITEELNSLDGEYSKIRLELESIPEYDVFICTKVSKATIKEPNNMERTEDLQYAEDLFSELKSRGKEVFLSTKNLNGVDYDAQILTRLLRSKVFVMVCTNSDYALSAWVASEWQRWRKLKSDDTMFFYLPLNNPSDLAEFSAICKPNYISDINILINGILNKVEEINLKYNIYTENGKSIEYTPRANFSYKENVIEKYIGTAREINVNPCFDTIGRLSFTYSNIRKISFYDVRTIGDNAFRSCHELQNVNFVKPLDGKFEGKITIGSGAFYDCSSLFVINIPENVEKISKYTFYGCNSLTEINLPGVKEIDDYAFAFCPNLRVVRVGNPKNLKANFEKVFENSPKMKSSYNQGYNIETYIDLNKA